MEELGKMISIALVAAVFGSLLATTEKPISLLVVLFAVTAIGWIGARFLIPVLETIEMLRDLSGISSSLTAPLLKIAGIGILTHLANGVCADSGYHSLGNVVRQTGLIMSVYMSLPLVQAVLELMKKTIGDAA